MNTKTWTDRIKWLLSTAKAEQAYCLLAHGEKTQYTHAHRQLKRKGGSLPKDYRAVELLCDLERLLDQGKADSQEAISAYFQAKRLLGF